MKQDPNDPLRLIGGILGRVDDMRLVRGVNVYPSAIDAIVRRFDDVVEYEVHIEQAGAMSELALAIEPTSGCSNTDDLAKEVGDAMRDALSLRVPVTVAQPGSLPRYEMKAKRWKGD